MKILVLVGVLALLPSCSNLGSSNNDVHTCRELAYKQNSGYANSSVDHIYNQCLLKKKKAREKQQRKENIASFMGFILDLFQPDKSS